jgi:hypothetical protein
MLAYVILTFSYVLYLCVCVCVWRGGMPFHVCVGVCV